MRLLWAWWKSCADEYGKSNLARHISQMDDYQAQRTMKRSGQAGRPTTAIAAL